MSAGFAGVDNDLFYKDKTMMLFGSAKDMVAKLLSEVKQLQILVGWAERKLRDRLPLPVFTATSMVGGAEAAGLPTLQLR